MDAATDNKFYVVSKWLLKQLPRLGAEDVEEYVSLLIKDGWDNINFIEDDLKEEDLEDLMKKGHRRVLMERLQEIRKQRADGQQAPTASAREGDVSDTLMAVSFPQIEAVDAESQEQKLLTRYINLLKYDCNGEEAMLLYNEWKESGRLQELAEKRVDDLIARLDPIHLADLKRRYPVKQHALEIAMACITPLAARPKPKGRLKRGPPHQNDSSSDEDSDASEDDEPQFESNLRTATHLPITIIQGAFQSGKSTLAAFLIIVAAEFEVVTVIITDKVSLSSDLKPKIQRIVRELLSDSRGIADNNVFCITKKDDSVLNYNCTEKGFGAQGVTENGAALVVGGSDNQISKARQLIEAMKMEHYCLLICDECDIVAGRRTNIKASIELRNFLEHRLLGIIGVTATPVPTLIDIMEAHAENVKLYRLKPGDNYVGPEMMQPAKDEDGNDIFLSRGELNAKNSFTSKTVLDFVTSACEKPRSLIIINVNNLVHVEGNINQQAKLIQESLKEKGRDVIAITIALAQKSKGRATDIQVFYPNNEKIDIEKGNDMCKVLDDINASDEWGLDIPVIVCGYSQLTRSLSVWSRRRVPTHHVVIRGPSMDINQYCQAFARFFGQSKDILQKNGFDSIVILAEQPDWEMFLSHCSFIKELFDLTEESDEPFHVVWNRTFSSWSDIFRSTNRSLSPNKLHKPFFQRTISCESGRELLGSENAIKEKYKDDSQFQRLLRTLLQVDKQCDGAWFDAENVQDTYNRMWAKYPINLNKSKKTGVIGVRNLLKILADSGKLDKGTKSTNGTSGKPKTKQIYRLKDAAIFQMLLNSEANID